ncbi:MAG: alkaline phosphatase family protein [Gammaproteobacteria bacterium]|nr:MAG: alkaline phosphatase family protein [Gammaproteobacteria bacterium]
MSAPRLLLLDVVGLSPRHLGPDTPRLSALAAAGDAAPIRPVLPAVTCPVQATYLTGVSPREHGIVANGWYYRDTCEVRFWQQANTLIQAEQIWTRLKRRRPAAKSANLFWWFNMYSPADLTLTVRPVYFADGRKRPDIYTRPAAWRDELHARLGPFPLFRFWGPAAGIESSRWIAAAAADCLAREAPDFLAVYLPHLDYPLQKFGLGGDAERRALAEIDAVAGALIDRAQQAGYRVVVLSEYGIGPVRRPVHLNRLLRERGWLAVRSASGMEWLDPGASAAFAVADHQVAHVYLQDRSLEGAVRACLEAQPGVAEVLDADGLRRWGLDHPRSGELVAVAEPDAWFTYYYWLDDARAPDFARTVDIHRKPGYDPVELFLDPALRWPRLAVAWRLARARLGFRGLLDVIPLDAGLVRGSHGAPPRRLEDGALLIGSEAGLLDAEARRDGLPPEAVHDVLLRLLEIDGAG